MDEIKINKLIRSRRKTICLIVAKDASLVVRAPQTTPNRIIRNFIDKKKRWIIKHQEIAKKRSSEITFKQFVDGEEFLYLGKYYPLKISDREDIFLTDSLEFPRKMLMTARESLIKWYQDKALDLISERVFQYERVVGLRSTSIAITKACRRWGSCGVKNTLNFSWRLILAPLGVIDYVVVHEVVHLSQKDHSKEFWRKVRALIPDFSQYNKWLNKNGHLLTL
ncbi:MAG: SprT family zinc-dependent metalloprotease [Candidatus Omnitrophica bacterium]|nr:SprT family zinc-dependent metalloprotease [Candidatus Omnitrophota bacterium]